MKVLSAIVVLTVIAGSILLLILHVRSLPDARSSVRSDWQSLSWRYSPQGKPCAELAHLPAGTYLVNILDQAGEGRVTMSMPLKFDSDDEAKKFVEGVCAKR